MCLECITSPEHTIHTFIKFRECLRNAEDKIAKRLEDIDKHLVSQFDTELSSVTEEIRIRQMECKTHEFHLKKENKVKQFRRYYDIVIISLRNYETLLNMYNQQLPKIRKKYADIMKTGSDILRYDTGVQLTSDIRDEIQSRPIIPELTNVKHFDDVMRKLQQEIGRISTTLYYDLLNATGVSTGMNINLMVTSMFDDVSPWYNTATTVSIDTVWIGEYNKKLRLITNTRTVLHHFEDDFFGLSVHPTTGQLYGSFHDFLGDQTVRSIDTRTGSTTTVIHCECRPYRIKVTHDHHVLVGKSLNTASVYRYKLTGELVHKSTEKYIVHDIDHCPTSNRVLLSCSFDGVVVLDNHLTRIHTFTGLSRQGREKFRCATTIFDNSGNIIVCDCDNKEIYILDSERFGVIIKLHIDGLSNIYQIRLYQNTMWVACRYPDNIMCIMMP